MALVSCLFCISQKAYAVAHQNKIYIGPKMPHLDLSVPLDNSITNIVVPSVLGPMSKEKAGLLKESPHRKKPLIIAS